MKSKKAQVAIEFIIIMGALIFFVSIFFMVVQNNTEEKMYQRESVMIKEIAITAEAEINLALRSEDGYMRNFQLPARAGNLYYEANIIDGAVYIRTNNRRHAIAIPVANVTGDLNITDNTIKKIDGVIYLNQ